MHVPIIPQKGIKECNCNRITFLKQIKWLYCENRFDLKCTIVLNGLKKKTIFKKIYGFSFCLFAHSCLYYLLSLQYTVLHILFLLFPPYSYVCIFSTVCDIYINKCTVHGADLTYILLLVIFCIIVYVTNKILNSISFQF